MRWGRGIALASLVALAACGRVVPPSSAPAPVRRPPPARPITPAPVLTTTPTPAGPGAIAATSGVLPGPPISTLPITRESASRALDAFRLSCPALLRRSDASGLTRPADWAPACAAANDAGDPIRFFAANFETVQIGDGRAYATGYYEPEIAGSRERRSGYEVPIYGRPRDLIDVDLGQFSASLKGRKIRGRVNGTNFVPYYERSEIEGGAIDQNAPIIAWAADPVALFFLQVQGSGRLRLPDGGTIRIGYDSQNGRDYTGIGSIMKRQGLVPNGSMQELVAWLRAHPAEGQAIMDQNKSYVFFRLLDGPAVGALGVAVTGRVSAAVDPKFVPLGAPVFLSLDRSDATGLWVAQDTGGAIKGANRFDTFWGAGSEGESIAGGMSARGAAFLLMPIGTVARLNGGANGGAAVNP